MKQEARLAFVRHVRHPDWAEMRRDCSGRGAAGVETGFDFGPIVDGNLAGLVKGFATGEFLLVPMWGLDVAGQFGLIHGRGKAELTAGLGFLRLDAAEDGFLEVSRTTKNLYSDGDILS